MCRLISLSNVKKRYPRADYYVLDGLSLNVDEGETVAVVGKSGCGKSTLLNLLALFDSFDEGEYSFDGKKIETYKNKPRFRNENLGFVFQSYNLIKEFTVQENILMPKEYSNKKSENFNEYFEYLSSVLGIGELLNRQSNTLSGGQQQRVAIARALINQPKVIFADEPTGNTDPETRDVIIDLFRKTNKEFGIAFVVVTHDREVANKMDTVYAMNDGRLLLC